MGSAGVSAILLIFDRDKLTDVQAVVISAESVEYSLLWGGLVFYRPVRLAALRYFLGLCWTCDALRKFLAGGLGAEIERRALSEKRVIKCPDTRSRNCHT